MPTCPACAPWRRFTPGPCTKKGCDRERYQYFTTNNYGVRCYRHAVLARSAYEVRKADAARREAWRWAREVMLRREAR